MSYMATPKDKRKIEPPLSVLREAKGTYQRYLARTTKPHPEDLWLAVGPNWDLNLWQDEEGYKATLYPVIGENTDATQPFPVILLLNEQAKD